MVNCGTVSFKCRFVCKSVSFLYSHCNLLTVQLAVHFKWWSCYWIELVYITVVHLLMCRTAILHNNQSIRECADNSLARPGRKQAAATKVGIYSTHCARSSVHFLARCFNLCKQLKKNSVCCPSNQLSAAAITFASNEKWRPFNCFLSPGNRW